MLPKTSHYHFEMIRSELSWAVGEGNVCTDDSDKLGHSIDYYWMPEMWHDRNQPPQPPDIVVMPETTEAVAQVMKIANNYKIPVVPWGGGSGSQGGALPIYGGIVLDTKKLNRVIEVDEESLTITAETGCNMQQLEWATEKMGFSTMHFPASIACATLGGFLAHRGTGVLSTKYGKIEDMVMSLEVVTPEGEIINTLPVPRHASGPDAGVRRQRRHPRHHHQGHAEDPSDPREPEVPRLPVQGHAHGHGGRGRDHGLAPAPCRHPPLRRARDGEAHQEGPWHRA
jgi:alkyldihydroxyacetonephosphate synthase